VLIGGLGADTLIGGSGRDTFTYMNATQLGDFGNGSNMAETIIGFSAADDSVRLAVSLATLNGSRRTFRASDVLDNATPSQVASDTTHTLFDLPSVFLPSDMSDVPVQEITQAAATAFENANVHVPTSSGGDALFVIYDDGSSGTADAYMLRYQPSGSVDTVIDSSELSVVARFVNVANTTFSAADFIV
jgi:hypothetical protein